MKKILSAVVFLLGAIMFSCVDSVDTSVVDNFPPSILSISPSGSTKVGVGFDLKIILVDGPATPLASVVVTLTDTLGNTIYTATSAVSGTKDSVIIKGSEFNSTALALGYYDIVIAATDKGKNETNKTVGFYVSQNLYAAKNAAMWIAGAGIGWDAQNPMTLTGAYTWSIKNIDLKGGQYKFKNTADWTDKDWGDPSCSGVMTQGAGNSTCVYNGLVNVTFNDETLKYTVVPAVNFAENVTKLFLLGTFNDFQGTDSATYKFLLTGDHSWEISEVRIMPNDQFRFSAGAFGGEGFGASATAGIAAVNAPNITMPSNFVDGFYKIDFNDKTLAYTLTFVRYPYPATMFLVGGATEAGWNPPTGIPFMKTDNGKFELYAHINTGDGFKFLPTNVDYTSDWGADPKIAGGLAVDGENNVTVATTGFYRINLDFTTKTYTVAIANWGLTGDGTPGNWPTDANPAPDSPMTWVSGQTLTVTLPLTAASIKFRMNDDWGVNLGGNGTSSGLKYNGDNIAVATAGTYTVTLNLDPVNGYSYTVE